MYEGYLEVGGTEIINAERTEAYVKNLGNGVSARALFGTDKIHIANEETAYESPAIDDAPWFSEADTATSDFFGLYPLEIEGFGDSTMVATTTEHLDDGASGGTQRDTSRAISVHGLLIAATADGAEAGLAWLGEAVRANECGLAAGCGAGDIRYFLTEPDVCVAAFTDDEQPTPLTETFGDLTAPEFLDYRWPSDQINVEMPGRSIWSFGGRTEGAAFRYGAMARLASDRLSVSDIIAPLRRNYGLNPGVHSGLTGWSYTGSGSLDWQLQPDDTSFGTMAAAAVDAEFPGVLSPTTGAVPAGPVTISIALRSAAVDATVAVSVDRGDGTFGGGSFALTPEWQTYSLTVTRTVTGVIPLTFSTVDTIDFTNLVVEIGSLALPYFDGTSTGGDYAASWDGDPDTSPSQLEWTGTAEIIWPDSRYRPYLDVLQGTMNSVRLATYLRNPITMLEQLDPYERTLHDVQCTQGPQVIKRYYRTGVGYFVEVDMVFVAGNPHPYSPGVSVNTTPLANAPYADPDDDIDADDDSWLEDPEGLATTVPVYAPVILDPSLRSYTSWQRYYVQIPASDVQQWGKTVPTIGINSKNEAIKQVRFRFHPNPFGYPAQIVDSLNFCGEVVLSYLPAAARIEIDGITQSAVASKGGKQTLPADHLLYGANGAPVTWPELSCAIPYLMTIDVPTSGQIDLFDVDLTLRRRG